MAAEFNPSRKFCTPGVAFSSFVKSLRAANTRSKNEKPYTHIKPDLHIAEVTSYHQNTPQIHLHKHNCVLGPLQ